MALCTLSCSDPTPAAAPRNLLLVTFDTTRADHLGCYGYEAATTPVLDGLAQAGVLFETCISVSPITLPSHASILTGQYPYRHGVRNNGTHSLPQAAPTLAEALARRGFDTGAVISAIVLDSSHGLDQGFEVYDDDLSQAVKKVRFLYRETQAEDAIRRARTWLEERSDAPWFLWVHLFDPHAGYQAPEPHASRHASSPYDGELAYADEQLGVLLDALEQSGDLDQTLVVATADHGESLGEHGEASHGIFIYDATTRVPLLMKHPSLPAGRRVEGVVSSVDILPTVLELLDVPAAGGVDGQSRVDWIRSEFTEPAGYAYSESMTPLLGYGWSDLRSLRDESGRFVRAPRPELYDLRTSEREAQNLYSQDAASAQRYELALDAMLPTVEADSRTLDAKDMSPQMSAALADLGYLWTESEAIADESGMRIDPKDRIALLEQKQAALALSRSGQLDDAIAIIRDALVRNPESTMLHADLVSFLMQMGSREEAHQVLTNLLKLPGVDAGFVVLTAKLDRELDKGSWRELIELAKTLEPRSTHAWVTQARWLVEDGQDLEAQSALDRALAIDERCAPAWLVIASMARDAGEKAEAESALRRALELDPISTDAHFNLGILLAELQRLPEAMGSFERVTELDGEHVAAWIRIGNLHMQAQRDRAASSAYQRAAQADPTDFSAIYNLGLSHMQGGRTLDAIEAFDAACVVDPKSPDAWRRLMTMQRQAENAQGALEAASQLLELDPENVQGLCAKALCLADLNREAEALTALSKARTISPERVAARAKRDSQLRDLLLQL
ncbi:MAG: choline-sulfatase [Planctomycetota bacterium]|jgi:choline-sulfatase